MQITNLPFAPSTYSNTNINIRNNILIYYSYILFYIFINFYLTEKRWLSIEYFKRLELVEELKIHVLTVVNCMAVSEGGGATGPPQSLTNLI